MDPRKTHDDTVGWPSVVAILLLAPCIGWAIAVFVVALSGVAVHPHATGAGYWAGRSAIAALPFALPGFLLYSDRKRRLARGSEKNA